MNTTHVPPPPPPRKSANRELLKAVLIVGLVLLIWALSSAHSSRSHASTASSKSSSTALSTPSSTASSTPSSESPSNEQRQLANDWVLGKPLSKEKHKEVEEALELPRVLYTRDLQNHLLGGGYDVDVTASGVRHTTLRVKWVLASKVDAYKLTNSDGFLPNLKQLGFRKFILDDGYENNWTWDLAKY